MCVNIIDFGSQYTHLIARRLREMRVNHNVLPARVNNHKIRRVLANEEPVILSGCGDTILDQPEDESIFQDIPPNKAVLGICYGMQLLVKVYGGSVITNTMQRAFGFVEAQFDSSEIFNGLGKTKQQVWMSHNDSVAKLPPGFISTARTKNCKNLAFAHPTLPILGLQFHPEVTHTQNGSKILENFVFRVARYKPNLTTTISIKERIAYIREQVGNDSVVLGLSGGVDSMVCALLTHRAIGKRLHCIIVDNGLLRIREMSSILHNSSHLGLILHPVNARKEFLDRLKNIVDPEQKRKIIGATFIKVFSKTAKALGEIKWLAQGTLFPDVVESAGRKNAKLIKSHHNVGGLPRNIKLKLLEPLRHLFKDEVRTLGRELGLGEEILTRHPFPGPGLAVRIAGKITKKRLAILRQADTIFMEELKITGWYQKVAQAFCVLLPVQSVGVMGDSRFLGYTIVLRAVASTDFMTASCAQLPHTFLQRCATRIINQTPGIARVCHDLTSKPPGTIEWE